MYKRQLENFGKLVMVARSDGSVMAALGGGQAVDQSLTRTSIMGRVEWELTPGFVDFYIEEKVIRTYCNLSNWPYDTFVERLSLLPHTLVKPGVKIDLGKNMKHRPPPVRVRCLLVRRPSKDTAWVDPDEVKAAVAAA